MVETYGGAALLIGASAIIGQGILVLCGTRRWQWWAPAVGFATIVVLCSATIIAPGRGTTSGVLCALALVIGAVVIWRARLVQWPWRALAVMAAPILAASTPFLATGRVGLLGVAIDNDTGVHLLWAAALQKGQAAARTAVPSGYPLGPHSVMATLTTATGVRLDHALTAVLLAVIPITALAAAGVVARLSLWRRALIGLITSVAYLVAAYYGQGSFKETMMALFLLAFVLLLRGLSMEEPTNGELREGATWRSRLGRARAGIPAGIVFTAGLDTYSYTAAGWFGGFLAIWLLARMVTPPSPLRHRARLLPWLERVLPVAIGGAVACLVVLAPNLGRLLNYFHGASGSPGAGIPVSNVGNLVGPLSPYESLGAWLNLDYRFAPAQTFHAGELSALALAVLIFGLLWALRRRDLALPAAVVACAAIYFYSNPHESVYVTAKSLAIAAPVVMLTGARGLLSGREDDLAPAPPAALVRTVVGLAFAVVALHSSLLALRGSLVGANGQTTQLQQLHAVVGNDAPTLYMGADDFAAWEMNGANLAYPLTTALPSPLAPVLSSKPYTYGFAEDFDDYTAGELDEFTYVITTRSPYASHVPPNFHLIRTTQAYSLYRRIGPTVARENIDLGGSPGAILDCRTPAGRKLSRMRGYAAVMTTPVLLVNTIPSLGPNGFTTAALHLPRGSWDLSFDYFSEEDLKVTIGGRHYVLPANTARPGPYYYFATVHSDGVTPVQVSIYEDHPSRLSSAMDMANLITLAATAHPDTRTFVPLSHACGKYVDWYRVSGAAS